LSSKAVTLLKQSEGHAIELAGRAVGPIAANAEQLVVAGRRGD
jgi:hypothetical protein